MHPNDTLNGRLLAFERDDEKHLRRKLGYWHMVEERMVREELEKEGIGPNTEGFWMTLCRRIEANHKDDPKPWHDRHGLQYGGAIRQQAALEQEHRQALTREEWSYLIETFADANHPLARSIAEKAACNVGPLDL